MLEKILVTVEIQYRLVCYTYIKLSFQILGLNNKTATISSHLESTNDSSSKGIFPLTSLLLASRDVDELDIKRNMKCVLCKKGLVCEIRE